MKAIRMNPLRRIIQRATSAPDCDLPMIENIMREDIFHSTLDWQTRNQIIRAAREAFALLESNRDPYKYSCACALSVFQFLRAKNALDSQQ